MRFLVLSMLVAAAVAGPTQRFLQPDVSGPTPVVPDRESIIIGPAIINPEPIQVGPAIINPEPIQVGPAIINPEPIQIGPAIINPEPIQIGPAIINPEPIQIGPAIVDESVAIPAPVATPEAPQQPVVQIIINVNGQDQVVGVPEVVAPGPVETEVRPEPVIVVEQPADPVHVVEVAPGVIGTPVFPAPGTPVITLPEELN